MKIFKLGKRRRKNLLIVVIILVVAAAGLLLAFLKESYTAKERIETLALTAAKEYCAKNQRFKQTDCSTFTVTDTRGPVDYGPTDGRDEYTGNWFITTKSSSKSDGLIYVVTNFAGDVQYINTTGANEYPYCKDGYAVYPEEPEKNGKLKCGYY